MSEIKKKKGHSITDRLTGERVFGVVLGDDADWDPDIAWCPRCGADPGQQCSSDKGSELGAWIHEQRESDLAHSLRVEA
jgi:hypothetical protein